ncbi:chitinase-3-like protein 1 [Culicoides brevitarsis]|uniref:chitinase-3-like protein 1 n=1 Tax=Culicoides brevitarsis TaxID=469753 RepID=UPI00307C1548
MNKFLPFLAILAIICANNVNGKEVVCYVDISSNAGYQLLSTLKPNLCTMVNLAFAQVDANGNILASAMTNLGNFLNFRGTQKAPKMLLSIGGAADWWSLQNFVQIAASPSLRDAFAQSCLTTCQQYGLSGIDVDWEFPSSSDRQNFVELLRAVKAKLAPAGYLLTVAVGTSNWWAVGSGGLDVAGVGQVVDYVKMMTYDFHANAQWDVSFGLYFNAPMDDVAGRDSMVNSLNLFSSVDSQKLILGLPLYGNAYARAGSVNVGASYSSNWPSTGVSPSYNEICARTGMTKVAGSAPQWTPYMYDSSLWISYENPESVTKKASLVNTRNLGGVMVWSLEKDDQTGACDTCPFPLMRAINNAVGRYVDCSFTLSGNSSYPVMPELPDPVDTTTTSTTTTTASSNPDGALQVCPTSGYFKHPDCTKFYHCAWPGQAPYTQNCQPGLFWNNQQQYCDWNCVP